MTAADDLEPQNFGAGLAAQLRQRSYTFIETCKAETTDKSPASVKNALRPGKAGRVAQVQAVQAGPLLS